MASDTPMPSSAPSAAAARSYAAPSKRNVCTRCPRRVPIARATPISVRRSAASITKMKNQEDARRDREAPEGAEHRDERASRLIGGLQPVSLDRLRLETDPIEGGP